MIRQKGGGMVSWFLLKLVFMKAVHDFVGQGLGEVVRMLMHIIQQWTIHAILELLNY